MLVIVDDEDRENEGDVTIAAEKVTPDVINFMAKHARGLICLPLSPEICDAFGATAHVGQKHSAAGHRFHRIH